MGIKPCPFCGNSNGLRVSGSNFYCVVCDNCDTFGPTMGTKEKAIELWNAAPRKEDTKMEKNCRSCKYLKLGTKIKNKWYCTKALEDEYSSCKSWAPHNPFKPTQMTVCNECQYEYWDNGEHYCGKAIWNLDYSCPGWKEKEPKPAPLNPSNSNGLNPFIPEASEVLEYVRQEESLYNRMQQLAEEAAELAQAVLKYNRAMGFGCYTPMSPKDANDAIVEEMADVLLCIEAAFPHCPGNMDFYSNLARVYQEKAERWAERLKEQEGEEDDKHDQF